MNVLLLSMPDSFEHMPTVAVQMPNGALTSLAGNIDAHHRVAVADLVLVPENVRGTVERLLTELRSDVVGLSVMTFQRRTAVRLVRLIRQTAPNVRIVVGGYDPSLAPEAYMTARRAAEGAPFKPSFGLSGKEPNPDDDTFPGVDFIVRGEGEITFRDLLRALEANCDSFDHIPGLTWRRMKHDAQSSDDPSIRSSDWTANPDRPVHSLDSGEIKVPNRGARVLKGYHILGRPVDVVETSRGCTYDCSFCSIIEMRGRNFHTYSFDRVIADLRDAREHGARAIFLVDDNITLNVRRFEGLCVAIIAAGLNDMQYTVQAMTSAIAAHGDRLAPLMRQAGFRYVFLGIENILADDLAFLKAASKNADRDDGRTIGNATLKAIDYIHRNKMYVVGGLIVGNPDDTPASIEANLEFARKYVDWPYIQHPTPYPRTPMTRDFIERKLIVNPRLHEYDGTTAVVKTESLESDHIEYLRWRAERWMKTRHIPAVIRQDTWFVLRNWPKMLAHTFRGSSWKTALGLESDRKAFARYKRMREAEREYC